MIATPNLEPELDSLEPKLVSAIRDDRQEIEIRTKRIQRNEELLRAIRNAKGALHPEEKRNEYGSKRQIIRSAISRIQKPRFTQDEVETEIRRVHPEMEIDRARIRAALWDLCEKRRVLRRVRAGTNMTPAEYEVVEPTNQRRRGDQLGKNGE